MSCADYITPAKLDEGAMEYAKGFDPNDRLLPFPSLHDAKRLSREVSYTHLMNQITFQFMVDKEQMMYDKVSNAQNLYNRDSERLRDSWFSETGPLAMLIGAMGFAGGSVLIDRPGTQKRLKEAEEKGRREANGQNGA